MNDSDNYSTNITHPFHVIVSIPLTHVILQFLSNGAE